MESTLKRRWLVVALLFSAGGPVAADQLEGVRELNLDKRCGQCHDVSGRGTLASDDSSDWFARLEGMGPLDQLGAEERQDVIGFLRYHGWELNEIVGMASERHLFEEKCGLCHSAERTFVRTMTPEARRATVMRMRDRAPEWLSQQDAETILAFLERGAPGVRKPEHADISGNPAEIFRVRCSVCHPLERTYLYLETWGAETPWRALIKRMQLKAPEWISDEEAEQIYAYLSTLHPLLARTP